MANVSHSWWSEHFIQALEQFMESGRLKRGRNAPKRMESFTIEDNVIRAELRGNRQIPHYEVIITFSTIDPVDWEELIEALAANAGWITKLLQGEIPETIETVFAQQGFPLLPESSEDFVTDCSCPDPRIPCKHITEVYFHLASKLDEDPFILFELRGITRDQLADALKKTDLGKALASQLSETKQEIIEGQPYLFTQPQPEPLEGAIRLQDFWGLPKDFVEEDPIPPPQVPALLIKKQGDFPPFWKRNNSFIEAMEEIYQHIRQKNKSSL